MSTTDDIRTLLARYLDWQDAHVGHRRAMDDLPADKRGVVPPGFAHSAWQMVEHLRRAQADVLDFCLNADYVSPDWPAEYWPDVSPASEDDWDQSIAAFRDDLSSLQQIALDDSIDLFSLVPTGSGRQTYARELLVAADHNAYHLGQLVALRRVLGEWKDEPSW